MDLARSFTAARPVLLTLLAVLAGGWTASPWANSLQPPALTVAAPVALPGGTLGITITGTPGAVVLLQQSSQPAEVDQGGSGLQFLQPGTEQTLATLTLPVGGRLVHHLGVPPAAATGQTWYVQALASLDGQSRRGNSVSYRVEISLPQGARRSSAIAVTPDGRRAYVGHDAGGLVSMIDAQTDARLAELPITVDTGNVPHRALDIVVDPEGRHAFVSNAAATTLAVIHAATGSVSGQLAVPRGNRGIGFDFRAGMRRVYVANETTNAVLVFEEAPLGSFRARASLPLSGRAPGPLLVLPDGKLAVASRTDPVLEIIDPQAAAGATTVALTPLPGPPFDLAWSGSEILLSTFVPLGERRVVGFNRVLRISATSYQLLGHLAENLGTDYRALTALPNGSGLPGMWAVAGAGSGTVLFGDSGSPAAPTRIVLAPGYPTATPHGLTIVRDPATGRAAKLYLTDRFRETVRAIPVGSGPPYTLGAEIALAWSGVPRTPLSGALTAAEDGEWFFRSVALFGGTPQAPNPVTCTTCHLDGASDNSRQHDQPRQGHPSIQVPPAWGSVDTAPYFLDGSVPTLQRLVLSAMRLHNHTGLPAPAGSGGLVLEFLASHQPPRSIHLGADGSMNAAQLEGKRLFEGSAQCVQCHPAPLFLPADPAQRTIVAGIGTGMAPINIPSLRGAWATAPYLHNGSARTLLDVLTINPADVHGQRAALLTADERQKLVAYLLTL